MLAQLTDKDIIQVIEWIEYNVQIYFLKKERKREREEEKTMQ